MYTRTMTLPVLTMMALFGLAGCGGGSGGGTAIRPATGRYPHRAAPSAAATPSGNPGVQRRQGDYFVGERATLTVQFSGGAGRIEPDIGTVTSGATVRTPVLDGSRELRLVVESTAGTVTRSLALPVRYRDQYRALELPFSSRDHSATLVEDGTVLLIAARAARARSRAPSTATSRPSERSSASVRSRPAARATPPCCCATDASW